jgi:hypothetical protein
MAAIEQTNRVPGGIRLKIEVTRLCPSMGGSPKRNEDSASVQEYGISRLSGNSIRSVLIR